MNAEDPKVTHHWSIRDDPGELCSRIGMMDKVVDDAIVVTETTKPPVTVLFNLSLVTSFCGFNLV